MKSIVTFREWCKTVGMSRALADHHKIADLMMEWAGESGDVRKLGPRQPTVLSHEVAQQWEIYAKIKSQLVEAGHKQYRSWNLQDFQDIVYDNIDWREMLS